MRIHVVTVLLAGVLALLASTGGTQGVRPQPGGVIRVGITQEILNLDPHVATAFSSFQVLDLVYESLLRLNPQTLRLEPNLAESWTVSPDGLTYTFRLRRGATFHDGSQVDATDVKYTIDRILDPATKSPQASFLEPVREVTAVDPFTVRITLKRPYAPFLSILTGPGRGIVPVNFEEKVRDPRIQTLGSGPYRLERFSTSAVRLVRHDRYWRRDGGGVRLPYADAVEFRVIPDPATLRAALRAGEVDLIVGFGVDVSAAQALSTVSGIRVQSAPDLAYSLVGIQNERAPLNDLRVRQALSLAVDRAAIARVVYSGRAAVAGPIPPTLEEWQPPPPARPPHYTPNPARPPPLVPPAAQPRVALRGMPPPPVPPAPPIAQVLREQVAPAGFAVEIEQVDFATFLARWRSSQFDLFVSLNGGSIDPDLHLYRHIHSTGSTNVFKFRDATVDALLDQGRSTLDVARRVRIHPETHVPIPQKVPLPVPDYAQELPPVGPQHPAVVSPRSALPAAPAESWLVR